MSLKKILPALLIALSLNGLYLFTAVWTQFTEFITARLDNGTNIGGLLCWVMFLAIIAGTFAIGTLTAQYARIRERRWVLIPLLVIAFTPIVYFNLGPGRVTCSSDKDCVGATYSCCPTFAVSEISVNRGYWQFRRNAQLCFLKGRLCPMIMIDVLPSSPPWDHLCVSNRCQTVFK